MEAMDLSSFERRGSPLLAQLKQQEQERDSLLLRLEQAKAEGARLQEAAAVEEEEEEPSTTAAAATKALGGVANHHGDLDAPSTRALLMMLETGELTIHEGTPTKEPEALDRRLSLVRDDEGSFGLSPMLRDSLMRALHDARSKASYATLASHAVDHPPPPKSSLLGLGAVRRVLEYDDSGLSVRDIMVELERLRQAEDSGASERVRRAWAQEEAFRRKCDKASAGAADAARHAWDAADDAAGGARRAARAARDGESAAHWRWRVDAAEAALETALSARVASVEASSAARAVAEEARARGTALFARVVSADAAEEYNRVAAAAVVSTAGGAVERAYEVAVMAFDASRTAAARTAEAVTVAKSTYAAAVLGPAALPPNAILTLRVYDEVTRRRYEYKVPSNKPLATALADPHARRRGVPSQRLRYEHPPGRVLRLAHNAYVLGLCNRADIRAAPKLRSICAAEATTKTGARALDDHDPSSSKEKKKAAALDVRTAVTDEATLQKSEYVRIEDPSLLTDRVADALALGPSLSLLALTRSSPDVTTTTRATVNKFTNPRAAAKKIALPPHLHKPPRQATTADGHSTAPTAASPSSSTPPDPPAAPRPPPTL